MFSFANFTTNLLFFFPDIVGRPVTWPHLVGKPAAEAKAMIEREHPEVIAVIIPRYQICIGDFCANRVWLNVNDDCRKTVIGHISPIFNNYWRYFPNF